MKVEKVFDSTLLDNANYDPANRSLTVTFVKGQVYNYENVPEYVWLQFIAARSAGKYFLANIRDKYAFTKIIGNNE